MNEQTQNNGQRNIFEKVYLKTHKFILREQSLFRAGEGVDDFLTPNSISL